MLINILLFVLGMILLIFLIFSFFSVNSKENPTAKKLLFVDKKQLKDINSNILHLNLYLNSHKSSQPISIAHSFSVSIGRAVSAREITKSELFEIEIKVRNFNNNYRQINNARLNSTDKEELRNELSEKIIEYFERMILELNSRVENISNDDLKEEFKRRIEKL